MSKDIYLIGNGVQHVVYAAALTGYGYRVHEIASLEVARHRLEVGIIPHTIIIDTHARMRDITDFLDFVRGHLGLTLSIFVIGANEQEARVAYPVGATEFLQRPVEIVDLLHLVQQYVA